MVYTCALTVLLYLHLLANVCTMCVGEHAAVFSTGEAAVLGPCGDDDIMQPHLHAGEGGGRAVYVHIGPVSCVCVYTCVRMCVYPCMLWPALGSTKGL